jgi:hypothetical protein
MKQEISDKKNPSLLEFDAKWRGSGRNFHAIICETIGEDRATYEVITEEMIQEWNANHLDNTFSENRLEAIRGILSSLDFIASDPELVQDEERTLEVNKGMVIWLDLLKNMALNCEHTGKPLVRTAHTLEEIRERVTKASKESLPAFIRRIRNNTNPDLN